MHQTETPPDTIVQMNVALPYWLQKRLRVTAAERGMRQSKLVQELLTQGLSNS